jgi:hypothetical protein
MDKAESSGKNSFTILSPAIKKYANTEEIVIKVSRTIRDAGSRSRESQDKNNDLKTACVKEKKKLQFKTFS